MKQLSKRESKYRSKIIAENHLKKDGQKYLDKYVKDELLTYKKIYLSHKSLQSMLTKYNLSNLCVAMRGVGTSFTRTANALQQLAIALSTIQ